MELQLALCPSEPNWRCAGRACDGQPKRALATNCGERHGGSPAAQADGPAERWHEGPQLPAFEPPNVEGERRATAGHTESEPCCCTSARPTS